MIRVKILIYKTWKEIIIAEIKETNILKLIKMQIKENKKMEEEQKLILKSVNMPLLPALLEELMKFPIIPIFLLKELWKG